MKDHARSGHEQVVALLLGVFVLLAALLFVSIRSKAEDEGGTTSATITGQAPSGISVTKWNAVTSSADLTATAAILEEGEDLVTYLDVKFEDENGCFEVTADNITSSSMAIYHGLDSGATLSDSSDDTDYSTCLYFSNIFAQMSYTTSSDGASPDCNGATDTDVTYRFTLNLPHVMSDTEGVGASDKWFVSSSITDSTGLTTSQLVTSGELEVNSSNYLAIAGPNSIVNTIDVAFGSRALGSTGTAALPVKVRNTSNSILDLMIEASDMTCTGGTIESYDAGNTEVGIRTGLADSGYSSLTQLNTAGTSYTTGSKLSAVLDANIPVETATFYDNRAGATSTGLIYFGLGIPSSGVRGTCTGSIILSSSVSG